MKFYFRRNSPGFYAFPLAVFYQFFKEGKRKKKKEKKPKKRCPHRQQITKGKRASSIFLPVTLSRYSFSGKIGGKRKEKRKRENRKIRPRL